MPVKTPWTITYQTCGHTETRVSDARISDREVEAPSQPAETGPATIGAPSC